MKHWWSYLRLCAHAKRNGAKLGLAGAVEYNSLEYGLLQGAHWNMGLGSFMGKNSVVSLGEYAEFRMGELNKSGRNLVVKMVATTQGARIYLGHGCRIEDDVRLISFGQGRIDVADHCFIGWGCIFSAQQQLSIGEGTAIAEYVSIRDHNHMPDDGAVHRSKMQVEPVMIGKRVWIGAKVTITAGVTIGDDVVIGANAVVTKDVASGMRVAGVPARPIG